MLLGAGKMGGALLEGWLADGLDPGQVVVVDPAPPPETAALIGERGIALNPDLAGDFAKLPAPAVILLAVKPQMAASALPVVAGRAGPGTLVVSIMAGKTLANLEAAFPAGTAIVRSIPNTPAAVGRGITVAVPNGRLTPAQRELAHALLAATGACEWIDDEALMDAATAVSGSGPAYVFLLVESLARAGAAAGLPAELAARLARATVIGSAELLRLSDLPADQLRRNVTSPGGTTAAALAVLMAEAGFDALLEQAVAAATLRGRELAG